MREALKEIDLDSNNKVAYIEYLLFKYKKTPAQVRVCMTDPRIRMRCSRAHMTHTGASPRHAVFDPDQSSVRCLNCIHLPLHGNHKQRSSSSL